MDFQTKADTIVSAEWDARQVPTLWTADYSAPSKEYPICKVCRHNQADYDGESQSFGDQCNACFWVGTSGPDHVHTLKYWTEYVEAHKAKDPKVADHRWVTAERSHALFKGDQGEQVGWYCTGYGCSAVQPLEGYTEQDCLDAFKALMARYDS